MDQGFKVKSFLLSDRYTLHYYATSIFIDISALKRNTAFAR